MGGDETSQKKKHKNKYIFVVYPLEKEKKIFCFTQGGLGPRAQNKKKALRKLLLSRAWGRPLIEVGVWKKKDKSGKSVGIFFLFFYSYCSCFFLVWIFLGGEAPQTWAQNTKGQKITIRGHKKKKIAPPLHYYSLY